MSFIIGIVIFIISICISISLHELGHFYFAKKFNAYVSEYMIGFGKLLWSKKIGETTYGVKAIWLGGYVKILGMFAPNDKAKKYNRRGQMTLAQSCRQESLMQLPEDKRYRAFYRLTPFKKIIVLLAGPATNLFLCILAVIIAVNFIGIEQPTSQIEKVTDCISQMQINKKADNKHNSRSDIKQIDHNNDNCLLKSPAKLAGLKKYDQIIAINDVKIKTWKQISTIISHIDTSKPFAITVLRKHRNQEKNHWEKHDINIKAIKTKLGAKIGIIPKKERTPLNLSETYNLISQMADQTLNVVIKLPVSVYNVGYEWFLGKPRSQNSLASVVGVAKISGDIASSDYSFLDKISANLMLFASVNMALFIFNLIPLTPLDGGHIATAIFESLKRKYYKYVLGKKYGYLDNAQLMPFTYIVIGIFIAMTIFLIFADIFNPIKIT